MSHTPEQKRKVADALKESMEHKHANVNGLRGGKAHEAHKMGDMAQGSPDAGDMGQSDKFSMGY